MTSNAANEMDDSTAQIQESYATKDYKLTLRITAAPVPYDATKDWILVMEFRCHDLLRVMREGLFWTTSNVVPEGGWIGTTNGLKTQQGWRRVWELREFADREESQCRWVATATLYGHSVKALADFRLHNLNRQNVSSAEATNKDGRSVFIYNHNRTQAKDNFNCFVDKLHPLYGSWWFWPMEAISDYDTLSRRGGAKRDGVKRDEDARAGDWSLI